MSADKASRGPEPAHDEADLYSTDVSGVEDNDEDNDDVSSVTVGIQAAEPTPDELPDADLDESSVAVATEQDESAAGNEGDRQLAELTCELVEKDELISALTEQLEDAAERLDRLHRAGADRAPIGRSSPAGNSPGLPEELTEHVGQLVRAWDDLDALTWMNEFDRKLDELTSLVSTRSVAGGAGRAGTDGTRTPSRPASDPAADSWMGRLDSDGEKAEETPPSGLAGWEEMKAQLMRNGDADSQGSKAPISPPHEEDQPLIPELPPTWDLEAPQPVDFENADRDALVVAVEERDVFISHLIRRLRSAPGGRPDPIDWEALNNAPEELRERLEELETRLEEVLRMEECDLSLERARLARERATLEQMRRDVDRRGNNDAPSQPGTTESATSRDERRWLRVFGFGRKNDEPFTDDDELYDTDS